MHSLQNRCPQDVRTGSRKQVRQMGHSNLESRAVLAPASPGNTCCESQFKNVSRSCQLYKLFMSFILTMLVAGGVVLGV